MPVLTIASETFKEPAAFAFSPVTAAVVLSVLSLEIVSLSAAKAAPAPTVTSPVKTCLASLAAVAASAISTTEPVKFLESVVAPSNTVVPAFVESSKSESRAI